MISYIFFALLLLGAAWCIYQISVADFRRRIIPDAFLFPLMLIGLLLLVFFPNWPITVADAVIGATFGYGIAAITGVIFDWYLRRTNATPDTPIGMGDIKLLGVGGLWLGASGLGLALFFACVTGIIWARHTHQRFIPFAPFFLFGGILAFFTNLFLL